MIAPSFIESEVDLSKFKKIRRLNKGGFGIVYLVQQIETGQIYAAKVIDCNDNKDLCKKIIDRELEIMMYVHNPTIIKFIGYSLHDFQNENNIIIFMELAENGSLSDVIHSIQNRDIPKDYNNTIRQIILVGVSRGIKYLHDRNIIHRDIKPGNILLDREYHPHLSDFGMSKFYEYGHTSSQSQSGGTLQYMAPEVINGEPYDTKADVYSFGILMYEVITNSKPYPDLEKGILNNYNFTKKVVTENYRPVFNSSIKKSLQDLIQKCWSKDPKDRPNFKDIFNKLAYGKGEDEDEDEDGDYYLDDVDADKLLKYVYEITQITDPIEKLNKQIEELDKENKKIKLHKKQLEEANHKLSADNDVLFNKSDELLKENKQLATQNEELVGINQKFKSENIKLAKDNESLTFSNKRLLINFNKLSKENDSLIVEISKVSGDITICKKDNQQLHSLNQHLIQDSQQLMVDNDSLTKEKNELTREKNQLIIENKDLTKNNDSLLIENEELSMNNKHLIAKNKKLTKDNKQLITFNKLAENKKEELSKTIQSLNDRINTLYSENQELSTDLLNTINEYEVQIISNKSLKFIKDYSNITVTVFNTLPLALQKLAISELISKSPNEFIIKLNALIMFLIQFEQFNMLRCLELITDNYTQLISEINNDVSIQLLSNITEILFAMNEIKSDVFISILKKINDFNFVLKYPTESFNEIFTIISDYKSSQFGENQMKIIILISGISMIDLIFQNNANINCIVFDTFIKKTSEGSFKNCSLLSKVDFYDPSFLTSINEYLFYGCPMLEQINIPSSVTKLGSFSFCKCSALTQIIIPSSVIEIQEKCFSECNSITTVIFDKDSELNTIGKSCFYKCTSLKEINIPSSVIVVGEECFSECNSLTKLTFDNDSKLKEIGKSCFKKCTSLQKIHIPSSVNNVGDECFGECNSLTTVVFNDDSELRRIGKSCFYKCSSLANINIPPYITEIDDETFKECESLTKLLIPPNVAIIGKRAFCDCRALSEINIPSSVIKIDEYAFNGCSLLSEIIIPSLIEQIGFGAFMECSLLKQITIPSSIKEIAPFTFNNCISLNAIKIPFSVTSIGTKAFFGCRSLRRIDIPSSVSFIGIKAFNDEILQVRKYTIGEKIAFCFSSILILILLFLIILFGSQAII